jgi:pyrroline-5-carboxylate reductase
MGCSLLLVGCGKMGGALLDGWLAARTVDQVVVVEPQGAFLTDTASGEQRIVRCAGVSRIPPGFEPDVVVLAVKPQVMDEVVPDYAPSFCPSRLARKSTISPPGWGLVPPSFAPCRTRRLPSGAA